MNYYGQPTTYSSYPQYSAAATSYGTQGASAYTTPGYGDSSQPYTTYSAYTSSWPGLTRPTNTQKKKVNKQPKDSQPHHCDICGISCVGQDNFTKHMTGRKHAIQSRKLMQGSNKDSSASTGTTDVRYTPYGSTASATSSTTTTATTSSAATAAAAVKQTQPPAGGKYFCELCHCYGTDHGTFQLHLNGKKHRLAAQRAGIATSTSAMASMYASGYPSAMYSYPTQAPITAPYPYSQQAPTAAPYPSSQQAPPPAPAPGVAQQTVTTAAGNIPPISDQTTTVPQNPPPAPTATTTPATPAPAATSTTTATPTPTLAPTATQHLPPPPTTAAMTRPGPVRRVMRPRYPPSTLVIAPSNANDDNLLNAKHAELSPSSQSAVALATLVRTLSTKLTELGKKKEDGATTGGDSTTGIPEWKLVVNVTKLVGDYAKGTMLKDHLCADIVVITQDPPTTTSISALHQILTDSFPNAQVTFDPQTTEIRVQENDYSVRIMVTWLGAWIAGNKKKATEVQVKEEVADQSPTNTAEPVAMDTTPTSAPAVAATPSPASSPSVPNPYEGVNIEACQKALLTIRQTMWFNDHSSSANIRSILRLMMDFYQRSPVFQALSLWALEIIVTNALQPTLPNTSISQGLRSVFAYIASGVLLHGVDFIDPCQQEPVSLLKDLSTEQRLAITMLAQEVVREIAYGKWDKLIGS